MVKLNWLQSFKKRRFAAQFASVILISLVGGIGSSETAQVRFTPAQRLVADQIISTFENNTVELQYGYSEILRDGRGITAGRAGFTSATGDLLMVVERFTRLVPDNDLRRYLPRLKKLAHSGSRSVKGLSGLPEHWHNAANDVNFRQAQDEVVDELYYNGALKHAKEIGAQRPITLLLLYDTVLQHGDGNDDDGLPWIIRRTNQSVNGSPGTGVDERDWSLAFLENRKAVLKHASNRRTRKVWAQSLNRVEVLKELVTSQNYNLQTPIVINPWGKSFVIR